MSLKLLAVKIRRRSVAIAVFSGNILEYTDTLHLCNEPEAVSDTVAKFLAWILENFEPASAAIGISRVRQGQRVNNLLEMTEKTLLSEGIPVHKIDDRALLESYAIPKLKNKDQLRPLVRSFWPHLGHKQASAFEAAALGFYLQVERLLSQH